MSPQEAEQQLESVRAKLDAAKEADNKNRERQKQLQSLLEEAVRDCHATHKVATELKACFDRIAYLATGKCAALITDYSCYGGHDDPCGRNGKKRCADCGAALCGIHVKRHVCYTEPQRLRPLPRW